MAGVTLGTGVGFGEATRAGRRRSGDGDGEETAVDAAAETARVGGAGGAAAPSEKRINDTDAMKNRRLLFIKSQRKDRSCSLLFAANSVDINS
jgi:hypothetical protein